MKIPKTKFTLFPPPPQNLLSVLFLLVFLVGLVTLLNQFCKISIVSYNEQPLQPLLS